jgi:hypothetical protein
VKSERKGNGVGPDEGFWKKWTGTGWRLERIGAGERLGGAVLCQ